MLTVAHSGSIKSMRCNPAWLHRHHGTLLPMTFQRTTSNPKAGRRPASRLPQEKRIGDIMAAARQVIEEKGYENISMAEIAERAGVVEGTLYRYFENKRDLLTKVANDWFAEVLASDAERASIRGTWNKLRHLIWRALM